ncbi:MAG: class I SAM-dependent methyltransferase [Planctomycetota bacterium]
MSRVEQVRPFYAEVGINVETYDVRQQSIVAGTSGEGDVEFYAALAGETGGPVLELGSGTGRVAWALAEEGFEVVGLEKSDAMLMAAEAKRWKEKRDAADLARFEKGDMAGFDLDERFPLVLVPYRSFQALLEPGRQRSCLACCRAHMEDDALLVIHVFDPRHDLLVPDQDVELQLPTVRDPISGNIVETAIIEVEQDPVRQTFRQVWRFTEFDGQGVPLRQEHEELRMRWASRQEMRWLFELEGLEVVDEYSDFEGSPPTYGAEQVWVLRKA